MSRTIAGEVLAEVREAIDKIADRTARTRQLFRPDIVYVASPYRGDVCRNEAYARDALRDCLCRQETPIVPHLYLTQVLDDEQPHERAIGLQAGRDIIAACRRLVAYVDLGISEGMRAEIAWAAELGVPVIHRRLKAYYPISSVKAGEEPA